MGFAGHTWIRKKVMGSTTASPPEKSLEPMKAPVGQSMREGASVSPPVSKYVPANLPTEEVIELARVASRHGGIYVSHVRNEDVDSLKSMEKSCASRGRRRSPFR